MKKTIQKAVAVLLLFCMALTLFASCKKDKQEEGTTTEAETLGNVTPPEQGDTWVDMWDEDLVFEDLSNDEALERIGTDGSWFDSFKSTFLWSASSKAKVSNVDKSLYLEVSELTSSYVTRSIAQANSFEIEFKLKMDYYGNDNGMYVSFGGKRLVIYFFESKLRFGSGSNQNAQLVYTDIGYDWHTYRAVVTDNIASVYLDGEFLLSHEVEDYSSSGKYCFFAYPVNQYSPTKMQIEYASYTILSNNNLKITSPESRANVGTGTTDVTVTSALSSTLAASGNDVEFYLNGVYAGKKSAAATVEMTFASLTPGVYSVYTKCGEETSEERLFTVEKEAASDSANAGTVSTSSKLQSSYVLKYTVGGDGTLTAGDGMSALSLKYAGGKLTYATSNGEQTMDAGNGDYIAVVDGGVAWLYRNGKMIVSYILPYQDGCGTAPVTTGTISNLTVEAHNATLFAKDFSDGAAYNADPGYVSYEYALEFEYTKGNALELTFRDSAYLLAMRFNADGTVDGLVSPQKTAYVEHLFDATEGTNLYRVYVSSGIAQIYINNVWCKSMRLPDSIADRNLYVDGSGIGTLQLREVKDLFYYNGAPSDGDWNEYFGVDIEDVNGTVRGHALKLYSQDTTVSMTLDLSSASGCAYLVARYNSIGTGIFAGYDFTNKYFVMGTDPTSMMRAGAEKIADGATKVTLTLTVEGNTVTLYCDGKQVATTTTALNGWGNVGYYSNASGITIASFDYKGNGNAIYDTTTHYTFYSGDHTVGIWELNGRIYVCGERTTLVSTDGGETFTQRADLPKRSYNMIVLQSGHVLSLIRQNKASSGQGIWYESYLSTDGGLTYSGPYRIHFDANNYRFTMNGRVMQASDGRIFFVSGETENENIGMLWVYYSDDEGKTWTKSKSIFNQSTTGLNLQEGVIVDLGNGHIRMYARNDCGFLYYSDSTDNGVTWSMELVPSNFPSVVSAFNVRTDLETGYIYMAWEYDNTNDNAVVQYPRTRIGVAVSFDNAKTWYYIGDADELNGISYTSWSHWNIGIYFTEDSVFVTAGKTMTDRDSSTMGNYMVRITKDTIVPMARFNQIHVLNSPFDDSAVAAEMDMNGVLVISSNGKHVYASGTYYTLGGSNGKRTMLSVEMIASFLGGTLTERDGAKVITVGAAEYVFTAGSDKAMIAGEEKTMTFAALSEDSTVKVSVEDLDNLLGLTAKQTETGAIVLSLNPYMTNLNYYLVHAGLQ